MSVNSETISYLLFSSSFFFRFACATHIRWDLLRTMLLFSFGGMSFSLHYCEKVALRIASFNSKLSLYSQPRAAIYLKMRFQSQLEVSIRFALLVKQMES